MAKWFLISLLPLSVFGNPSGSQAIAGNVSFHEDGNHLFITAGDRSIIEWQHFAIGEKEIAQFIQPGSTAAVLNKVVGDLPSSIMGKMIANGHVLLINPHGILMGPNSTIDTAALTLSTLPLFEDGSFLNNESLHFCQNGASSLQCQGTMVAQTGDIVLIAPNIALEGNAAALQGTVRMGIGSDIVLRPEGEERIFIQPSKFSSQLGLDIQGQITALNAELKADGNAYALAICVGDMAKIAASKISSRDGRIWLVAEEGDVLFNGEIAAPGGEVQILGKTIALDKTALIDVSSKEKGGSVYIGGGCHGDEPLLYNSKRTYVSEGATLMANALETGDGGKIILWSDGLTSSSGKIHAEAGRLGGDGGFVEVSGLEMLDFRGFVSTNAPFGKTGTLLLDPAFIDITVSSAASMHVSGVPGGPTFMPTGTCVFPGPGNSVLEDADLNFALLATNVVIDTTTNAGGCNGNIIFDPTAAVLWTNSNSLTLTAAGNIDVNSLVQCSSSGAITAIAAGSINIGTVGSTIATGFSVVTGTVSVTSTAGSITLQGGTSALAGNAVAEIAGAFVTISAPGNIALIGGAGLGMSNAGIAVLSSLDLATTGGSLTLTGGSSTLEATAFILTLGSTFDTISAAGNIVLQGGTAAAGNSSAFIDKSGTSVMNVNAGGTLELIGGTGTSPGNYFAFISGSAVSGDLILNVGAIQMTGGTSTLDNADAYFQPQSSPLTINCAGSMTSTSTNPNSGAYILGGGQPITLNVGGDLTQTGIGGLGSTGIAILNITGTPPININVGGNYTLDTATILTNGNLAINVGGDFTLEVDSTAVGPIGIDGNMPGTLSITAGNNISITGFSGMPSQLGIIDYEGPITLIAGKNITIGDSTFVGTPTGNIVTFVCDNDFPTPPGIGPGAFTTESGTLIGNGFFGTPTDQVFIFTARRSQNSINSLINGAAFVPGPFEVDTAQEQWGVYYPDYSDPVFVIFYKEGFVTPVTPVSLTFSPNFMELFRDLHPYNEYIDLALDFSVSGLNRMNY